MFLVGATHATPTQPTKLTTQPTVYLIFIRVSLYVTHGQFNFNVSNLKE